MINNEQLWSGFGRLDGTPAKRIFDAASAVYAAAGGQLLFIRDGRLLAQDFDPVGLELKGEPLTVANGVTAATVISASTVGPIVYRSPSPDRGKRQLVWVDRSGEEMDKVIYADFAHRVLRFRMTVIASQFSEHRTAAIWTSGRMKSHVARGRGKPLTPAMKLILSGPRTTTPSCSRRAEKAS